VAAYLHRLVSELVCIVLGVAYGGGVAGEAVAIISALDSLSRVRCMDDE
jgi:hypothetical protein